MTFLLDVNVLVALIDRAHVHHDAAHAWFGREAAQSWATCPLTENAVLRILGNPRYPGSPGSPAVVAPSLDSLRLHPGHVFWPDSISVADNPLIDASRLLSSAQVTDTYLLAMARANNGLLATFDRRLVASAVRDGAQSLHIIA